MSENSAIEWTDATWSPWEGCTKVSPGCDHCYAEGMNRWLRKGENWGPGAPRRVYSSDHWDKPLRWNRAAAKAGKRMRVFPSVCDPFDNEVAPIIRARFFDLILATPNLDWLLLTKRIGNMRAMLPTTINDFAAVFPNVWIGATVVNQEEADRDIPKLLAVPARVRFLSIEPMLGPIDLTVDGLVCNACPWCAGHPADPDTGAVEHCRRCEWTGKSDEWGIDWVIAGGESGPHARPAHPDWFRSLRDQCAAAGVAFLLKQHGEWIGCETEVSTDRPGRAIYVDDGYVVDLYDGRRYETMSAHGREFVRIGKKAAGRVLDGIQHDGFPT